MIFPILGPSSLPVVMTQPDERHACKQNGVCVGVVRQTQSIQHLEVQTKKYYIIANSVQNMVAILVFMHCFTIFHINML